MHSIIQLHFSRYPRMQIVDLYKLIHQASLGSEHALRNFDLARKTLWEECEHPGSEREEPAVDSITSDNSIARVHLQPWLAQGGSKEDLFDAFMNTAENFEGDIDRLKDMWELAVKMAAEGEIPFSPTALENFGNEMADFVYPARSHSEEYQKAYKPAYRVIAIEYLKTSRVTKL